MSRSFGNAEQSNCGGATRTAPGILTLLCSYGYFSRTSTTTGASGPPLSSRSFNASLLMRGIAMGIRVAVGEVNAAAMIARGSGRYDAMLSTARRTAS